MSITKNLSVEYHQQDTDYYCGAACAQMVLKETGTALLSQDDLYNDNHSHSTIESGWATAPDGLNWTLNNLKPAPPVFNSYFVLDALDTEESLSRILVWTISHYQIAPVALVYGSQHWIVIRGFEASAAPTSGFDTSYVITGFYVNNPWPPVPTPGPPPPHSTGDVCGSGGVRGIANEYMTYSTWQTDYMTGATGGYWGGKFVAVCDPTPPPKEQGSFIREKTYFSGEEIVERATMQRHSLEILKTAEVFRRPTIANILDSAEPGTPVLVQRLDKVNSFYYIVPFTDADGDVRSLVNIDARFGNFKQSAFAESAERPIPFRPLEKETIFEILGKRLILPREQGVLNIYREAVCVYPNLVWMPCAQSLSPYWPFHMVTVGSVRIYIRIDGEIFTELTTDLKGI